MWAHDDVIKWNYFTGDSPHMAKASDAELYFFLSAPVQTVEQMI